MAGAEQYEERGTRDAVPAKSIKTTMPENKIGEVRRSHCLANFGPGAVAEFRDKKGAAISGVVMGLDEWPKGTQRIYERRLQAALGKEVFCLPPVDPDEKNGLYLKADRFPSWQQCPKCNRVRPHSEWGNAGPGEPALICPDHDGEPAPVYVTPVRFVVTCEYGHLQDFPWDRWIIHKSTCKGAKLKLTQSGLAGLAGLVLSCDHCGESKSFENAFQQGALDGITSCHGRSQWLDTQERQVQKPNCTRVPRVVQRGASNLYFPVTLSALAIPPFTEPLQTALNEFWPFFQSKPESEWPTGIKWLQLEDKTGATEAEIVAALRRSKEALAASTPKALRHEEFMKFDSGAPVPGDTEFEIRKESVPPDLAPFFSNVVRAVRLREVRAQLGFTRIDPPAGEQGVPTDKMARLSYGEKPWLPAIEMRGEGIFMRLDEQKVVAWEAIAEVQKRAAQIDLAYASNWKERFGEDTVPPRKITARLILVHTLAHALIRQLTLACGYSSASLRERLYADMDLKMAGILIYTATTDSDGSLGGLERQGRTQRIGAVVNDAIRNIVWCSNDPLCIEDTAMFSDAQNLAACHACVLAPETSCEEFNLLLDRAMLVGKPGCPDVGFFKELLAPENDL